MADTTYTYAQITSRIGMSNYKELLTRIALEDPLRPWLAVKPAGRNKGKIVNFRRYELSSRTQTTPITEGVTPDSQEIEISDYSATLQQYGGSLKYTDVTEEVHEDNIPKEFGDLIKEQAKETWTVLNWNVICGGTTVAYMGAGATGRTTVCGPITEDAIDTAIRVMKRNRAPMYDEVVAPTVMIATEPLPTQCYVAFGHTDLLQDLQKLSGWIPAEKYSQQKAKPGEEGTYKKIRFILSSVFASFGSVGAAVGATGLQSTDTVSVDVFGLVIMAKNFAAQVPVTNDASFKAPIVVPANKADSGDPLGQRGYVSWKGLYAGLITCEEWGYRIEGGVDDLA